MLKVGLLQQHAPSYNGHTKGACTLLCSNYTKYMSQVVCMQLHASTMACKYNGMHVQEIFNNQHNTQHCRNGGTDNYGHVSMYVFGV